MENLKNAVREVCVHQSQKMNMQLQEFLGNFKRFGQVNMTMGDLVDKLEWLYFEYEDEIWELVVEKNIRNYKNIFEFFSYLDPGGWVETPQSFRVMLLWYVLNEVIEELLEETKKTKKGGHYGENN